MKHICEIIYKENPVKYGNIKGICRITGNKSQGLLFDKWVKKTFNDHGFLKSGTIISNEALFCFDEASELIQKKTGKEKKQRFRTYSHIVDNLGNWHCLTKANKREIYDFIINDAKVVCLTETGQKHIFFKHKLGFWQLDELFITPDIELFKFLHKNMCELMRLGFSQAEIIENKYRQHNIKKMELKIWYDIETKIKAYRGKGIFDFVSFMLFTDEIVNYEITKKNTKKMETKSNNVVATQLSLF
jgi:hypothetical protein